MLLPPKIFRRGHKADYNQRLGRQESVIRKTPPLFFPERGGEISIAGNMEADSIDSTSQPGETDNGEAASRSDCSDLSEDTEVPRTAQEGPLIRDNKVRWYLGRKQFTSFAHYEKALEVLLHWSCECFRLWPREKSWAPSLRKLKTALSHNYVDVRWYVQDVLNEVPNATFQPSDDDYPQTIAK